MHKSGGGVVDSCKKCKYIADGGESFREILENKKVVNLDTLCFLFVQFRAGTNDYFQFILSESIGP